MLFFVEYLSFGDQEMDFKGNLFLTHKSGLTNFSILTYINTLKQSYKMKKMKVSKFQTHLPKNGKYCMCSLCFMAFWVFLKKDVKKLESG